MEKIQIKKNGVRRFVTEKQLSAWLAKGYTRVEVKPTAKTTAQVKTK